MINFGAITLLSTFVILIVFVVLAVGGVVAFILINKKKNGDKSELAKKFTSDKLVKGIVVLAIIGLAVANLIKITDLEAVINNQNNTISQLNQTIWSLENEVSELEDQVTDLIEATMFIQDFRYSVTDIDTSGNVEHLIRFTLRELNEGETVKLVISDGIDDQVFVLTSDTLTFTKTVLLEDDHDYELSVLIEGDTTFQESLGSISVQNDFAGRFDASGSGYSDEGVYKLNLNLKNYYVGSEDVKIDTITIDIYINGSLYDTIVEDEAALETSNYELFAFQLEFNASEGDNISITITAIDNLGNIYSSTQTLSVE